MPKQMENKPKLLTGAKQTMMTWTRLIESYDEVPEAYQSFFETLPGAKTTFPYTILAPPLSSPRYRTTEKLLCDHHGTLYVLELMDDQVVATGYPLKTIRDIEIGTILLYSWITISGMTEKGIPASSTIEFNTATIGRFTPFVDKIRPHPSSADKKALSAEQAKFDYLMSESYKFMNYARGSLVCGEKVIDTVWQPEIRERILSFLNLPIYRTLSTTHVTILTDKELILIREDERSKPNKGARYGGVWQYIPLRSIASTSLKEETGNLLTLSITLFPNGNLDKLFTLSNQAEVARLQSRIKQCVRSARPL